MDFHICVLSLLFLASSNADLDAALRAVPNVDRLRLLMLNSLNLGNSRREVKVKDEHQKREAQKVKRGKVDMIERGGGEGAQTL